MMPFTVVSIMSHADGGICNLPDLYILLHKQLGPDIGTEGQQRLGRNYGALLPSVCEALGLISPAFQEKKQRKKEKRKEITEGKSVKI